MKKGSDKGLNAISPWHSAGHSHEQSAGSARSGSARRLFIPALGLGLGLVLVLSVIFLILHSKANEETYVQVPSNSSVAAVTPFPPQAGETVGTGGTLVSSIPSPQTEGPDGPEVRYLTDAEITAMLEANSEAGLYTSAAQQKLVEAAVSLVGKVHYFWGGKSTAMGMDPEWGKPQLVEGEGHETCGTIQPFGLDCSGYVNWCFVQLQSFFRLSPDEIVELIGNGTWNQWNNSEELSKKDVRIGDIAFIHSYPTSRGNHVGICVGFDASGEPLIAQCSNTMNNVVVSTCEREFLYFRRVPVWDILSDASGT